MLDLPVLNGYCTIQLYRTVPGVGNNLWPHTLVWEVCGNTLVDECNFQRLNQYRWRMVRDSRSGCYYAKRLEKLSNGKYFHVVMAREVLGLPSGAGHGGNVGDHWKHDTLDNTLDNLRPATKSQSMANRRSWGIYCQFKGVSPNNLGFHAHIQHNGQHVWFLTVRIEVEAALMYNYAAYLLFGKFAHLNQIPEDEIPSEERQEELWQMVLKKLREVGLIDVAL